MLISLLAFAAVQFGSGRVADPVDFTSHDGSLVLHVESTTYDGEDSAVYTLSRDSKQLWTKQLGFAFAEAAVNELGTSVGYGIDGDDFFVAIIDATGKVAMQERTEQVWSRFLHSPMDPVARGLIPDFENERFAVRIADKDVNRGIEAWWRYDMPSATRIDAIEPARFMPKNEHQTYMHIRDVQILPGTDLQLVHWWTGKFDIEARGYLAHGGAFSLIDQKGQPVWRLDLPFDYTIDGDERADDALEEWIRAESPILQVTPHGAFDLHLVREQSRVRFQAIADPDKPEEWLVSENSRTDYVWKDFIPKSIPTAELKDLELVSLGSVELVQTATKQSALMQDSHGWTFDGKGGFTVIRRYGDELFSALHIDQTGTITSETPFGALPEPLEGQYPKWYPLGGDSWLVATRIYGKPGRTMFWRANSATGKVENFEGVEFPRQANVRLSIDAIEATGNGSFMILGSFFHSSTMTEGVFAFDADGKLKWSLGQDYGNPEKLFSPEDICMTSDGGLAVLGNSRKLLQMYDADGHHEGNIDLEALWGQTPNYLSKVCLAPNGDLLVFDFNTEDALWRISPDGTSAKLMQPKLADGTLQPPLGREARFAPDGSLWTTDGYFLHRLDDQGRIDLSFGNPVNPDVLYEPGSSAVLADGRICIQDQRTGALHVWNEKGERLFVGETLAGDADQVTSIARIVSDSNGSIWVKTEDLGYLGWDSKGNRLGLRNFEHGVAFVPGTQSAWTWDWNGGLALQDKDGETTATIDRHPDRKWLRYVDAVQVGASGQLLVLDESDHYGNERTDLLEYKADGSPVASRSLPGNWSERGNLQKAGDWILMGGWEPSVLLLRSTGVIEGVFSPPQSEVSESWSHGLSTDGKRLLSLDKDSMSLHRFALPE